MKITNTRKMTSNLLCWEASRARKCMLGNTRGRALKWGANLAENWHQAVKNSTTEHSVLLAFRNSIRSWVTWGTRTTVLLYSMFNEVHGLIKALLSSYRRYKNWPYQIQTNTCEALRTCTVKLSIPVMFFLSQFTLYVFVVSVVFCSSAGNISAGTMSRVTWS